MNLGLATSFFGLTADQRKEERHFRNGFAVKSSIFTKFDCAPKGVNDYLLNTYIRKEQIPDLCSCICLNS